MSRAVFGVFGTVVVIVCAGIALFLGVSNEKASMFQINAVNCTQSRDGTSNECQQLIKFGVEPQQYFSDKDYRSAIDKMFSDRINRNAYIAPKVAQFTLDYAYRKNVKLAADLYKQLTQLSEQQDATNETN